MRDKKHHGNHEHEDERKKKKRKKRRHHPFMWMLIIILLLGIILGLLINAGLIFPGGKGWLGGAIGNITGSGVDDGSKIDTDKLITPATDPVPTVVPDETAADAYIRVSESKVFMNNIELKSLEDLIAQLGTATYKGCKVHLIDDYATKVVYDNVKTILANNGISISSEE